MNSDDTERRLREVQEAAASDEAKLLGFLQKRREQRRKDRKVNEQTIPAKHPELVGSIDWTWRKDDWRYVLWGSDACGQVWQSGKTEWGWHAGGGFGFCETFAEAREQAEQAVADWLRSQQREQALNALAEQAQELDMGY